MTYHGSGKLLKYLRTNTNIHAKTSKIYLRVLGRPLQLIITITHFEISAQNWMGNGNPRSLRSTITFFENFWMGNFLLLPIQPVEWVIFIMTHSDYPFDFPGYIVSF